MADNWQVISQRQTSQITPDGRFINVVDVTFQIKSGATATIQVPQANYNADYVSQEIDKLATQMIAIENL